MSSSQSPRQSPRSKKFTGKFPKVSGPIKPISPYSQRKSSSQSSTHCASSDNHPLGTGDPEKIPQLAMKDAQEFFDKVKKPDFDWGALLQPFWDHSEEVRFVQEPDWSSPALGKVDIESHPYYAPAIMAQCSTLSIAALQQCATCLMGKGVFRVLPVFPNGYWAVLTISQTCRSANAKCGTMFYSGCCTSCLFMGQKSCCTLSASKLNSCLLSLPSANNG